MTELDERRDAAWGGHGGVLRIDLGALMANYRSLAARAGRAETAAAVKGDGYGIGLAPAARALARAGCLTFFVAHLSEAETLRTVLPPDDAVVYVLNGLLPGLAPRLAAARARPVLGSLDEIAAWRQFARDARLDATASAAAIQVDTGFNRLGLSPGEVAALAADRSLVEGFTTALVLSHLACADDAASPMSVDQLARFGAARAAFAGIPASLANSAGLLAGADYHFDMVRPGIALYGGRARIARHDELAPVAHLDVPVIQTREVTAGESVGYGATYRFNRAARIALVSIGYADGFLRAYSATNARPGARLFVAGQACPVVGRVSMDITAIDVSSLAEGLAVPGAPVEVVGINQSVDDLAAAAGTIGYEVLTHLGLRHARVYSGV